MLISLLLEKSIDFNCYWNKCNCWVISCILVSVILLLFNLNSEMFLHLVSHFNKLWYPSGPISLLSPIFKISKQFLILLSSLVVYYSRSGADSLPDSPIQNYSIILFVKSQPLKFNSVKFSIFLKHFPIPFIPFHPISEFLDKSNDLFQNK